MASIKAPATSTSTWGGRRARIRTAPDAAYGVYGFQEASSSNGRITISVADTDITTVNSHGVLGYHAGSGNIDINVGDVAITTTGVGSHGIYANHPQNVTGANKVTIKVTDIAITTEAEGTAGNAVSTHGVYGFNSGADDLNIDVTRGSITTKGIYSYGVHGIHAGAGSVDIDVRDAAIRTESTGITLGLGAITHGVYGFNSGADDLDIDVTRGSITTAGDNAHGIVAYHLGTTDSRAIALTVGGSISVGGENAHGVRVGALNAEGEVTRAAGLGEDGYRRQTVTVNGAVMGSTGAGGYLAGGGRVVIGPRASPSTARRAHGSSVRGPPESSPIGISPRTTSPDPPNRQNRKRRKSEQKSQKHLAASSRSMRRARPCTRGFPDSCFG